MGSKFSSVLFFRLLRSQLTKIAAALTLAVEGSTALNSLISAGEFISANATFIFGGGALAAATGTGLTLRNNKRTFGPLKKLEVETLPISTPSKRQQLHPNDEEAIEGPQFFGHRSFQWRTRLNVAQRFGRNKRRFRRRKSGRS